MKRIRLAALGLLALSTTLMVATIGPATAAPGDGELRAADAFASIGDQAERSAALFVEAGKVLTHARCVNCHPAGDAPLQGEAGSLHEPPARRGRGGLGVVGMQCRTCHQKENFDPGRVPGAPAWHLAPRKMAWEGLSLAELCEQIKDPRRNGNRTLDKIVEHMAEDELVGWAWQPGADREPPPGDQKALGKLIAAWVESGAVCPG